jgi:hypothetical protein
MDTGSALSHALYCQYPDLSEEQFLLHELSRTKKKKKKKLELSLPTHNAN